jgi:adenosylcobinamide-phosphate synthase
VSARRVIATAYLLDWLAGDPEWFPHPVRLMGRCIESWERTFRRCGKEPFCELVDGGLLTFGLVSASYVGTAKLIRWMCGRSRGLGIAGEIVLAWTCFASRNLYDEASSVVAALDAGDISLAREKLARVVGRDTQYLDEPDICRAVIETVAESTSDGVIAPLFYMAIGGVPLAMAYKAINTLDSMIGHADRQYFYFGKLAARLDDAANFLPARLTALTIATSASLIDGGNSKAAIDTWLRDGTKHKSPNAGHPESAMAGALQARLGGTNSYSGEAVATPVIGEGFPKPSIDHAKRAVRIATMASIFGAAAALLMQRSRR